MCTISPIHTFISPLKTLPKIDNADFSDKTGILATVVLLIICVIKPNLSVFNLPYDPRDYSDSIMARIWLTSAIVLLPFFSKSTDAGIGLLEVMIAAYYHGSLILWFLWHLLVRRRKIFRNGGDVLSGLFFAASFFSVIVSYGNDVEPMQWIRSWQLPVLILFYFPIREHFRTRQQILYLIILLSLVFAGFGLYNLYEYKQVTAKFTYGYEVLYKGVRNDASMFGAAGIIALMMFISMKNITGKIISISFATLYILVLMASLARTSWVAFLLSLFILVFLLDASKRRLLIGTFTAFIAAAIFVLVTFFPNASELAFTVVETRLSSSVNLNTDKSYLGRVLETQEVMRGVMNYPLGGNGFQKEHLRYDLILMAHLRAVYSHNGYSGLMFKAGIPLAVTFWLIILYHIITGVIVARKNRHDALIQILSLGSAAALICYSITNYAEGVYESRSGLITTGYLIALIGSARLLWEKEMLEKKQARLE